MSSEGSVTSSGSRIRQFGLYRTIDARTEEFLRSSRKRQIRQGCACAAISTAITVTVVVSVILVYEYSINSESNNANKKNSLKPNWIGLMNDSDITSISSKFNKKINFDRTTLKLLPILLKALNKNRYLEKILEEYSSSSPPYEGKDSTEATFTKNVFADSRYWLKLPTTRHYSTDHKTSPLINWKTPTQRLEYLTKIRKIRDYQRMLNYFDKMINDKVGLRKEFDYTENPLTANTVPMTKKEKMRKIQQLPYPHQKDMNRKEIETEGHDGVVICSCPKKLGLLLSRLISALQDLVPQVIGDKLGMTLCKNKTKHVKVPKRLTTARPVRPTKHRSDLSTIAMKLTRKTMKKSLIDTRTTPKCCTTLCTTTSSSTSTVTIPSTTTTPTTTPTTTTTVTETSTQASTTNKFELKSIEDNLIQVPTEIYNKMQEFKTEKSSTDYSLLTTSTELPITKTTKIPEVKRETTETIVPIRQKPLQLSTDKWLQAYALDSPSSRLNLPLYKEEEYDDYFNNKPRKTTIMENIDVQSMESLKTKTMSSPEDIGLGVGDNLKRIYNNPTTKQQDLELTSMRKLADMIYLPHEKIAKVWKYTIEPELTSQSNKKYKHSELQDQDIETNVPDSVESSVDSTTVNTFPSTFKNTQTTTDHYESTIKYQPRSFNSDQIPNENVGDTDEFQDDFSKPTESIIASYKYKNSSKSFDTSVEIMKHNNPWNLLDKDEKAVIKTASMLPALRPIYLEIQRNNEWKQDEHGDYDLYNFNSNIFDLPTID